MLKRTNNRRVILKTSFTLALLLLNTAVLGFSAYAQTIQHAFPFHLPPRDTSHSQYLPQLEAPAGKHGALTLDTAGHIRAADGTRLRFFGTELNYNANFPYQTDIRTLALRLRKLGFNAVRLTVFDYFGYDDYSIFSIYDSSGATDYNHSYHLNKRHLAIFDSLLYEFKQAGIYTVITLSSAHQFGYGEGVSHLDSLNAYYYFFLRYTDPVARELERQWVSTLLNHVNPLTSLRLADDPAIAVAEITWQNTLYYYWSLNLLNYVDSNNTQGKGSNTVNYYMSKRFDTLYTTYLKNKYGTDGRLSSAWMGDPNPSQINLLENGSFEDPTSPAWSFIATNGAKASFVDADGGVDSLTYKKIRVTDLTASPQWGNIYAQNLGSGTFCGKDTLYELTFWAKMPYDSKRPTQLTRQIYLYIYSNSPPNYGANVSTYITIDTAWKQYSYTFRASSPGLQGIRAYLGGQMGDTWLDAFSLHRKAELGLVFGESLNNYSILRLTAANLAVFPLQRMRDQVMFLDSLELSYYSPIQKLIKDTLHFKGLVNFTQQNYWLTPPTQYISSFGDVTEGYVGWDYIYARPNEIWSDSTWQISNLSELHSTYAGNFGYYMPMASVVGKAYFANVSVPNMSQQSAEQMLLVPTYASYQDWDGIFFTPFAYLRNELFQDSLPNIFNYSSSSSTIQSNTEMLALAPAASAAFRSGMIDTAEVFQQIEHDANDVWLWPYVAPGRGPWGVEGYLDPNIITSIKVRQKFNGLHKLAGQYDFLSGDTSLKQSDTKAIQWDQTNGLLTVSTARLNAAGGHYGNDTISLSKLKFSRTDGARDMMVLYYTSMDPLPLDSSAHSLLTISTRSQNSGLKWRDSVGWGSNWGGSPMLMSAATVQLQITSKFDSVLIYPLDTVGNRTGSLIMGVRNPVTGIFTATIDQTLDHSAWFDVEKKNLKLGVSDELRPSVAMTLSPNPATIVSKLTVTLPSSGHVSVRIIDDLGRTVRGTDFLGQKGTRVLDITTGDLAQGHYIVRVNTASGSLSESLNVIR